MDGKLVRASCRIAILASVSLSSCAPTTSVDALPSARETLATAGKRLVGSHSVSELTTVATRGDKVLSSLTRSERDALARGYLRFRIDRPADVVIAAPRGFAPFWVADLKFEPEGATFRDEANEWDLYRKAYGPGVVGLGVNGLDRTPPAHYAVFVRSRDARPVTVSAVQGDGWQVLTARDGMSLSTSESRPVETMPVSLCGSTMLRTSNDLRHSILLAGGRVWKTHVVSARKPDQVVVSLGGGPEAELVWSWRTSPEVKTSIVRLRPVGSETVREVRGESETIASRELLNDPVIRRHSVRVDALASSTAYEYSLGDGTAEGMTAWATVRAAPSRGDTSLLYMGDPQCGLEGWGKLLASARRARPDAAAVLIAGDLVDRGNERTNWDHFFLRASGVFERIPVMPCVGNHEYLDRGPWLYRSTFSMPPNGPAGVAADLVYSFEVGDALIAVLDSTLAVSDPSQARIQAEWLDDRLARSRKTWKLVMFHHPVYASHASRESPSLRDAWVPVFDKHRVDFVLQGHDHAYLRTYPMRANRRVGSPSGGTVYVVSVSGDKYYDQDPREYTEVGFTGVSTYQTIDLSAVPNRLVYRSFDAAGKEWDRFVIEKPGTAPRVATGGAKPPRG